MADRSTKKAEGESPSGYENRSRAETERQLGKPIIWTLSDYARPCAGESNVALQSVRRDDLDGLLATESFYELKDVGGILEFYNAADVALSPAIVFLRTDDSFVPLQDSKDLGKRLEWELPRLRKLQEWLGISEEDLKSEHGAYLIEIDDRGVSSHADMVRARFPRMGTTMFRGTHAAKREQWTQRPERFVRKRPT